jgi:hypothetical protein
MNGKLVTGYKLRDIVGNITNDDKVESVIVNGFEFTNDLDLCSHCMYSDKVTLKCKNEYEIPWYECKRNRYYYRNPDDVRTKKSSIISIDMNNLANSCQDFCLYYEKNCYNSRRDVCMIRLIEKCELK